MIKNILPIILTILFASCEYEDFDDNKDVESPLATCVDGVAKIPGTDHEYSCLNYDLMGHVSLKEMDAEAGNDCWGWTDQTTGREYAIMGVDNGTVFIDITDPTNPLYLGKLPTATVDSSWRDMKVYNDHVYIVSEAQDHGLQVFNLAKLRGVESAKIFSTDFLYNQYGQAHNIAINEETGYAYTLGARTRGIHALNISDPLSPQLELEAPEFGYSHDAQVVIYKGPDQDYIGKEIYIGSNEDKVDIIDVTNKSEPKLISTFLYDHQYTHQSWLTTDHKYALLGDEVDEVDPSAGYELKSDAKTRTIIIDLTDLDNPKHHYDYYAETKAVDHNGYVNGTEFFLASYTAGMRVLDVLNIDQKSISEKGFFNTFNDHHDHDHGSFNKLSTRQQDPGDHIGKKGESEAFNGAWSVYPFFKSENIIISDINSGLFIVKKQN
jgi:choice-of-anchor B domain-containing protein